MALDVTRYILIDNHAHPLLKDHLTFDAFALRRAFSESRSRDMIADHVQHSVHYMDMVSKLGLILSARGEDEILQKRAEVFGRNYVAKLWDSVFIGALVVDDGFSLDSMMSLGEFREACQRPVFRCRRIESVIEDCLMTATSFEQLERDLLRSVFDTTNGAVVALKSIMAYRGGLDLDMVSRYDAMENFEAVRATFINGKRRIEKCPLYHYLLLQIFQAAGAHDLPVQLHVGLGDDDALIVKSNPALFQPALKLPALQNTRFVLLHCYPYVREAAMLCSLYANVYMDLSLTVNLVASRGAELIGDVLAGTPSTKLLAGTDGHSCPETHWYAALRWKLALQSALNQLIMDGMISAPQGGEIAARVLHENAKQLYSLEGLA